MRSAFENATRGRGFASEWRDDEADAFGVGDRVLQYARAADIVIVSQSDPDWPGTDMLDVADRLAMESGRPVLIVPRTEIREHIGERVLVAWNARREAARAVFDALPILQRAKEVKVVWVNPQTEHDMAQDIPAADICTTLARHGVACEATEQLQPRANVGETLLACAKDYGADLMVMGCYGHARLREFVFGGASRHVLRKMSTPCTDVSLIRAACELNDSRSTLRKKLIAHIDNEVPVDPQAWLADVLARIAGIPQSRLVELLPWEWKRQ
jgi:nucleotide-binding universal stress UspA family protein